MQVTVVSLFLAAFISQASAVLFVTNPTASTSAQGGQVMTITWMDNGTAPTLADIGPCEVGVYAGNMQQQTELQAIAPALDVSKQLSVNFTVNANLGPNYNGYFIRFASNAFKDPNNPQYPFEAFSSLFTLGGMSGQFSPSVAAQVSGITSASSPAATPAAVSSSASAPKVSTPAASGTKISAVASSVSTSSAPKSTQSSSAASTMRGNVGVLSAIGVVGYSLVGLML